MLHFLNGHGLTKRLTSDNTVSRTRFWECICSKSAELMLIETPRALVEQRRRYIKFKILSRRKCHLDGEDCPLPSIPCALYACEAILCVKSIRSFRDSTPAPESTCTVPPESHLGYFMSTTFRVSCVKFESDTN